MENHESSKSINQLIVAIESLIPQYLADPADKSISEGNLAICIIDSEGSVHEKMYGTNKPRLRQSYRVAWTKASQVWLTGVKTGEYERLVFTKQVEENGNGIEAPDLIGWEGGQPLRLKNGQELSVGFSGLRGVSDIEIVLKALAQIQF